MDQNSGQPIDPSIDQYLHVLSPLNRGIKNLISDCDGVLVDSEVVAFEVLIEACLALFPDLPIEQLVSGSFGQMTEQIVQHLADTAGEVLPPDFLIDLRRLTNLAIENRALPMPYVESIAHHPHLRAVVSNSSLPRIESALGKVGLLALPDLLVISSDMVAKPKPAPDVFLLTASLLGVDPQSCIVIEDSATGVQAAKQARMSVIGFLGASHIPPGHADVLKAAGADALIKDLRMLPQVCQALAGWAY